MKVDDFVDKAIKKIDEAVGNAYDQASAKFLQQVNEVQSSTQKVDDAVNKAVKRSYDQAFAKFSEQAIEAHSSTEKVDEVIQKALDEALAKFSERLSELSASPRTQQTQQGTANPRGSEQEPLEIEEDEIVSVSATKAEDDSEDESEYEESPEDTFNRTCEQPLPGSIYAIHADDRQKSMLTANKDSELILGPYSNGRKNGQNCHWQCIEGPDDSFYFQNMKTRKYIGVNPERLHKMRPFVTSKLNEAGDDTDSISDMSVTTAFCSRSQSIRTCIM